VVDRDAHAPPRFASDEPALTVLHVSDLQFGKHHRFADPAGGFDTLLRRLCDDLDLLARDHGLAPDVVALTGDLAEWGMRSEFEQVAVFCEQLRDHLEIDPDRLLVVPGNHDINRKLCSAYFDRCAGDDVEPRAPYWPKWEHYVGLFQRLYRDVERYRFTQLEPWTLFEISSLQLVVAGLNSTIHETHRDADHHGFLGEPQLRWFADRLADHERRGWLRLGMVHHNAVRRAAVDDENLKDADDLRDLLGEQLHLILHGHTHEGRVEMLGPSLPVISTGSAAVARDQRPGPPGVPGEVPNQYQLVRLTRNGLWHATREYTAERKRWVGDNRASPRGDRWWAFYDRTWRNAGAMFPSGAAVTGPGAAADDDTDPDARQVPDRGRAADLLDEVIAWCRIRDERSVVEIERVLHRGPWGHHARVRDRERGTELLGACDGELTAEVLDRWVADVHEPFRGRGRPVSRLVVASDRPLDPALRAAAQARGVEVERMIDYQRVLDTAGYRDRLRDRLDRDRAYPSEYYLEQRVTAWSPVDATSARIEQAADWLAARLLEPDGAFVLVLGQAGVGKTFLLREVARRLARQQAITPILIELRDLERARTVDELAAIQFSRFDLPWHPRAFRRDLEDGRLALLFDGFDELALRVRSAAIPAHFERIHAAAVGRARIVVSSRTEHFLSSGQVADLMTPSSASTTPLGGLLERVPRRQVLEVHPFEPDDVVVYLRRRLGDAAGATRFARLSRVHDLVGLARNPRMLGFLVDIPDDQLEQAAEAGGAITSDALYRMVVEDAWLAAQAERLRPPGAAPGPDAAALRDAATRLALELWRDPQGGLRSEQVGAHAGPLLARMCDDDTDWTAQTARARTLLTRDDQGRIAFIHQTVLEWLVARHLAEEIAGDRGTTHLEVGRLNAFMVDLLRQRLGDHALARWAEACLASSTGRAAENAREVLHRLNREAAERADHRDQDLRGQELGGQSLRHALLDRANLTGARLVGRDLTGASLVGAQLAYADFTDAYLQDADLRDANLKFACFHRADLRGAQFDGARLTGASFLGARDAPALDAAHAMGVARTAPPAVEAMYARTSWGGCRLAISRDGTVLASGHGDGTVCLWDSWGRRLLRILAGHDGRVWSVALSPDGRTLASSGDDDTVRLWDTETGTEEARLAGHDGRVFCVAFSPDGRTLASGGDDDTVRLWDIATATVRARLVGHRGRVWSVAFSPDGRTLASGGADPKAKVVLWNTADGSQRLRFGGPGRVFCVAFSPDGRTLASADDDAIQLRDAADGNEQAKLVGHRGRVWCAAFSPDGRTLASAGDDEVIRLWNAFDGKEQARLTGHRQRVLSVAFSPDGKTLTSSGDDDTVRRWSAIHGAERAQLASRGGSVWSVAFSPDGDMIASGAADGTIRLWRAARGSEHARLAASGGPARSVAFSPDGKTVIGSHDGRARLWRVRDSSERGYGVVIRGRKSWNELVLSSDARIAPKRPGAQGRPVPDPARSPGGGVAPDRNDDSALLLWNAGDRGGRTNRADSGEGVLCAAFSPDGKTAAGGASDGTVRLWHVANGREHMRLAGHMGRIWSVAFSPDGKTLASGSLDATVRVWDVEVGIERACLVGDGKRIWSVAFSADGETLASSSDDGTIRLWNTRDGRERTRLAGHCGRVWSVALSADGKTLASAGADRTVRLWDAEDGRERACLTGHGGRVLSVAFSPDGRLIASGADDATVRLWDVEGARCLVTLYGAAGGMVAVRPDGRYRADGLVLGSVWHVIGLHRYELGELDALVPGLRLADDEPLYTLL
jgi:WD40 repeat protein/3',5'-cyclic AMP phosphodiesterase CpdA